MTTSTPGEAISERIELDDGGFAHVDSRGPRRAQAVIILPPLGIPGAVLDPFCDRLARSLRVHTVELPGTGRASGIRAGATTRDLGAALRTVVERGRMRGAHLFGISMGGMIAQWAVLDGGGCFDRVVLASTAARGVRVALADAPAKLAMARCLIGPEPVGLRIAREVVSAHVRRDPVEMERIERAIAESPRDPEEIAWLAAAALRHDTRAELAALRGPALVLSGDHDELIPLSLQDELAAAIGAERNVVPGAGHDIASDQPIRAAEAVERFLLG